jgi:DNA-binding transcriptional LysR family regulator
MGLRELALIGQGAAWLPGSLIADDLQRGSLLPLPALGQSVPMNIVVFFAILPGERGDNLMAKFHAICGGFGKQVAKGSALSQAADKAGGTRRRR